ncbi:MAG: biotin/lipoyl-containing protein, partial [Anaerolineales bacterium]
MADLVIMPKLGFDMAEGTLVRWVANEGENVEKGAILAEIETDKATVEVESTHSGVVHQYLVEEGEIVPVGDPIAVIGDPDEEIDIEKLLGGEVEQAEKIEEPSKKDESEAEVVEEKVLEEKGTPREDEEKLSKKEEINEDGDRFPK